MRLNLTFRVYKPVYNILLFVHRIEPAENSEIIHRKAQSYKCTFSSLQHLLQYVIVMI